MVFSDGTWANNKCFNPEGNITFNQSDAFLKHGLSENVTESPVEQYWKWVFFVLTCYEKMCFSVIRSFSWLPWLNFFCKGRRSWTCNCFQNFQCYFLWHFLARFGFFVRKQLNDQSFWTLLSISDLFKFIYFGKLKKK